MPRGPAPTHHQQRDALLDGAAAHFAEAGYPSASMAALASQCGVSKSLLYHYYPSKDAMLFDLLQGYLQRLQQIVSEVQATGLPHKEVLPSLIRRFMREYEHSRDRQIVLLNDVSFLPTEQQSLVIEQQRAVVAAFATAIAAHCAVDAARASVLAMTVFGMINWTFTWLRPDGSLSFEHYADTVISLLDGGLSGAATQLRSLPFAADTLTLSSSSLAK